jgi:AcrR family transcriptional regulator
MPRRRPLTPRKSPRQERAVATVDAILQAAAYILVKGGWEALTTNRVAERAGVNIASLYQYFPNKEAIVVELQRRHVAEARARFPSAEAVAGLPLPALLRMMIEAGVREHRVAPALHRVFSEELPRSARPSGRGEEAQAQWRRAVEPLFENVPDADIAAFVARVAVHAVIHEAASERPALLGDDRLVDEIVLLLDRYLRRPAPRWARARGVRAPRRSSRTTTSR